MTVLNLYVLSQQEELNKLKWISGHIGIEEKEVDVQLYRQGTERPFVGSEQSGGLNGGRIWQPPGTLESGDPKSCIEIFSSQNDIKIK